MKSIPQYTFYKTKYGDELLIDVVELSHIKRFITDRPAHTLTYYDITLITEGTGFFNIDNKKYIVNPGDIIFSNPGEARKWDIDHIVNGYALIFEEEFLLSFFNDPNFLRHLSYFQPDAVSQLSLDNEAYARIYDLIRNIKNEINTCQVKDKHILRALLYEILMLLNRVYANSTRLMNQNRKITNHHINKFMAMVNDEFKHNRSIKHYADKLCITPNYLNEIIKKTMDITAKQYIQNRIMREAKRVLAYTKLSVSEIADDLGFDNASYFASFFRKQTGNTPLEYKKTMVEK